MKPGQELDALVAEKIMEIPLIEEDSCENWIKVVPPPYSTDIAAAWEVVEELQRQDWCFILDNMKGFLGNWQAHFERNRWVETAESTSAPHAICLAALKVIKK